MDSCDRLARTIRIGGAKEVERDTSAPEAAAKIRNHASAGSTAGNYVRNRAALGNIRQFHPLNLLQPNRSSA